MVTDQATDSEDSPSGKDTPTARTQKQTELVLNQILNTPPVQDPI